MRTQFQSLALLSGLRIWCSQELWCRSQMWLRSCIAMAVAVAQASSYSFGSTPSLRTSRYHKYGLKKQSQKKKKKKSTVWKTTTLKLSPVTLFPSHSLVLFGGQRKRGYYRREAPSEGCTKTREKPCSQRVREQHQGKRRIFNSGVWDSERMVPDRCFKTCLSGQFWSLGVYETH